MVEDGLRGRHPYLYGDFALATLCHSSLIHEREFWAAWCKAQLSKLLQNIPLLVRWELETFSHAGRNRKPSLLCSELRMLRQCQNTGVLLRQYHTVAGLPSLALFYGYWRS